MDNLGNELLKILKTEIGQGNSNTTKLTEKILESSPDLDYNRTKVVEMSKSSQFSTAISKLENELNTTAAPELGNAIEFFQKKLEWLRGAGRISFTAGGARSRSPSPCSRAAPWAPSRACAWRVSNGTT